MTQTHFCVTFNSIRWIACKKGNSQSDLLSATLPYGQQLIEQRQEREM